MVKLFKYPNATFLTTFLFETLQDNLMNYIDKVLEAKKGPHNLLDQYSLYYILSIMHCNISVMAQCNVALTEILDLDTYTKFIDMYQTKFLKLLGESARVEVEQGP
mmetsp:Transcript_9488/g.9011  ORF Transcript_9488/g.9011 Transcript_9488/m.9011 type:complete len:106 (-) Transcript_9488:927-1244(-)